MPRFSECWRCGNAVGVGVGISCQLCNVARYCSEKCQRNDVFRHEAECIPASILKTCTACRKSGPNLKACTGCYRAFYCDGNCQRNNWERHKIDCLEVKEMIKVSTQLVLRRSFERSEGIMVPCDYYYWGNVPAYDCLNLVENEGAGYTEAVKVLILGVGDLRNVALTCASLPDSYENKIVFTLNDREYCVLARLVLLVYMLSKGDSGIEKTVTEIWYSIQLGEEAYKRLRTSLEDLIGFTTARILQSKTDGLISINEAQFKRMQDVWKTWLNLRVQGTKWIQMRRQQVVNSNIAVIRRNRGYIESVPFEHASSARKWINDGVFNRTNAPAFAENPTLTGVNVDARYAPYSYYIQPDVFPFCGWDYLQVKKFKSCNCLVTMYGEYIECILRNFMKKLQKQQVSFQIVLSDCMHVQRHLETGEVYDRILTSNLMDYILLPDLLKLCSEMLNHSNEYSTIITETITWIKLCPQGDITWPANQIKVPVLLKIAIEDTGRSSFADADAGTNVIEYLDNSREFYDYLRALFYARHLKRMTGDFPTTSKTCPIPITKELGNEFQLRLRDGIQNENRIVFFRQAINRRRVSSFLSGFDRFLEWVPLQKA